MSIYRNLDDTYLISPIEIPAVPQLNFAFKMNKAKYINFLTGSIVFSLAHAAIITATILAAFGNQTDDSQKEPIVLGGVSVCALAILIIAFILNTSKKQNIHNTTAQRSELGTLVADIYFLLFCLQNIASFGLAASIHIVGTFGVVCIALSMTGAIYWAVAIAKSLKRALGHQR